MTNRNLATQFLDEHQIDYQLVSYIYDPEAEQIGIQAANALGVPAALVFKTLMFEVDGKAYVALLPSNQQANMKKLAAVFAGKRASMLNVAEAERLSGYKVGGISPFGQRHKLSTVIDQTALEHQEIYVNGGGRGLQVKLKPNDVIQLLSARVVDFIRK